MAAVEPLRTIDEFLAAFILPPAPIRDSRFGLRNIPLNENEKPSIWVHSTPGRGQRGESQN